MMQSRKNLKKKPASKKVSVQQPHIRGSREGEKRSLLEVNEHFRPTDNKVDGAAERLPKKKFTIAVLTGGPSKERGISLNSARSVLDHLLSDAIDIQPIYFDFNKKAYKISKGLLYSNTPSDFDFRLQTENTPLSKTALIRELKKTNLVFPAIHGKFGEDGEVQKFLEKNKIPFVGTGSKSCEHCFDKYISSNFIASQGFYTLPSLLVTGTSSNEKKRVVDFFKKNSIQRAVVKPASGGSSIGVYSVTTVDEAMEKAAHLFEEKIDSKVVIEPFADGIEFTVIILQNRFGLPVAIIPTEIESDYEKNQIFDYRKKYLPTRQVIFHCPPRFSNAVIEKIQVQAEQLFSLFGMKDFARFDGWVLSNGEIWFSDFNPLSGMEQNSFLFQQSTRIGLSHRSVLYHVVSSAASRYNLQLPDFETEEIASKKKVAVLFGGNTSERQVSLMSGTNVWLKLKRSNKYIPKPYLIDPKERIWEVPYSLLLNHTVEEIVDACERAETDESRLRTYEHLSNLRLGITDKRLLIRHEKPKIVTLDDVIEKSNFVFIALHGGKGEDGTLQGILEGEKVKFNGSGSIASKLCMNKFMTGAALAGLEKEGIFVAKKVVKEVESLIAYTLSQCEDVWEDLCLNLIQGNTTASLPERSIIVKPLDDGCSSGIVKLTSAKELFTYLDFLKIKAQRIPAGYFTGQNNPIEMGDHIPKNLLFERYIVTDRVAAVKGKLSIQKNCGWIEVTVGVLQLKGKIKSLQPTLTVAETSVLSVEEKFQGGTGINITPLPTELVSKKVIESVRSKIEKTAQKLHIKGYARIDAFVEYMTGNIIVIEANTLPALTPSTVLFHQGIAEGLMPLKLLEAIIEA
jgi:D-alanine--D-alanine ligase